MTERHPCPCCGNLVFDRAPGSFEICPICWWKDDATQLAFPTMAGGANTLTLVASQANFQCINVSDERFLTRVRAPLPADQRDPDWRPFNPSKDPHLWWESSDDRLWWERAANRLCLYWWRTDFWLVQETPGWRFLTACPEGRSCEIDGIDVWKHKWQALPGERAIVKDPHYGQIFRFSIYRIPLDDRSVVFAAGEFSNSMWGFYGNSNEIVPADVSQT
jgi:hypothetical protein